MSKVVPLKIDTGLGKVKPKDRGLDMVEFANNDELRRNQLEKLVAVLDSFLTLAMMKGLLVILRIEILSSMTIFG